MKLWALSDLHLPGGMDKPMDVFGPAWKDHAANMAHNWDALVGPDDTVLVPGDISWAMHLADATQDLAWLGARTGKHKILVRGNHDYWWSSLKKLEQTLAVGCAVIQNNAIQVPPFVMAGTRGWELPTPEQEQAERKQCEKLYRREAERLRLSLEQARQTGGRLIVMMHFPPAYAERQDTLFTELIDATQAETVVYGHLHSQGIATGFQGMRQGTHYLLASADAVDFAPVLVAE